MLCSMSRPAQPSPDGEPPQHRIQIHTEHLEWIKATMAAKRNGLKTLASLCRVLMAREFERLGITDELAREEEQTTSAKRTLKKAKRS
jgi:hypothetical protein